LSSLSWARLRPVALKIMSWSTPSSIILAAVSARSSAVPVRVLVRIPPRGRVPHRPGSSARGHAPRNHGLLFLDLFHHHVLRACPTTCFLFLLIGLLGKPLRNTRTGVSITQWQARTKECLLSTSGSVLDQLIQSESCTTRWCLHRPGAHRR